MLQVLRLLGGLSRQRVRRGIQRRAAEGVRDLSPRPVVHGLRRHAEAAGQHAGATATAAGRSPHPSAGAAATTAAARCATAGPAGPESSHVTAPAAPLARSARHSDARHHARLAFRPAAKQVRGAHHAEPHPLAESSEQIRRIGLPRRAYRRNRVSQAVRREPGRQAEVGNDGLRVLGGGCRGVGLLPRKTCGIRHGGQALELRAGRQTLGGNRTCLNRGRAGRPRCQRHGKLQPRLAIRADRDFLGQWREGRQLGLELVPPGAGDSCANDPSSNEEVASAAPPSAGVIVMATPGRRAVPAATVPRTAHLGTWTPETACCATGEDAPPPHRTRTASAPAAQTAARHLWPDASIRPLMFTLA